MTLLPLVNCHQDPFFRSWVQPVIILYVVLCFVAARTFLIGTSKVAFSRFVLSARIAFFFSFTMASIALNARMVSGKVLLHCSPPVGVGGAGRLLSGCRAGVVGGGGGL